MKLYVGNLPWSIDDKALGELFSGYGNVEEAVIIKDKFSKRSKGFGFVTLDDEVAKKAIVEMHEKEVSGRKLTVAEAKPMAPRDNNSRFAGNSNEASEAPVADPSAINQVTDAENSGDLEVLDEDSSDDGKELDDVKEAMDDAANDEPAVEDAVEAEETIEEED